MNDFLVELHKEEDKVIDNATFSKFDLIKDFKEYLFLEVHNWYSLEEYISNRVPQFLSKYILPETVFQYREDIFSASIKEIFSKESISEYKNLDELLLDAAFHTFIDESYDIWSHLILVYSFRELHCYCQQFEQNIKIKLKNHGDFEDFISFFTEDLIKRVEEVNEIRDIEGYSISLFNEYVSINN